MSLQKIIIDRIRKEGPIPFRDYMEMCLYHPVWGYYASLSERIGLSGDFFTSPCVTPLFGETIAMQLEEMWFLMRRKRFTIVEYGAGPGLLCKDILSILSQNKELYENLDYYIIEKSEGMRTREKKILPSKVQWIDSIADISPINGCIISNEVIDNFSVHRVIMKEELMEIFVDYKNEFFESLQPASPQLKDYLQRMHIQLPRGARAEINLQALDWIASIAAALGKGFVLTIDYGYAAPELYSEKRHSGTLTCYHRHVVNHSPYIHIGEQDITAHVNFSALHEWGARHGLAYCGFTNQAHFLRSLGLAWRLQKMEENEHRQYDKEMLSLLQTFLLEMGSKFKVLIQQKGMEMQRLSGLAFAQRLE